MAKKRYRAPRLREQFKDNAHEVVKNAEYKNELYDRELRVKEMEYEANPKKGAPSEVFELAEETEAE